MKNEKIIETYIKDVITGFKNNKGNAYVYCFKPFNYIDIVYNILIRYLEKHDKNKILIAVGNSADRTNVYGSLAGKGFNIKNYNITILTENFINIKYRYNYDLVITININDNLEILEYLYKNSRFNLVIFTKNIMNNIFINTIERKLKYISTTVNNTDLINKNIELPVEEERIYVPLNKEDEDKYNKYTDMINNTIAIFGNLKNIENAKYGDKELNISAAEIRNNIAKQNGWSNTLNTNTEYLKKLDEIYNPNNLLERCSNFYNFARDRRDLVTDNKEKLNEILKIVLKNKDKKILIISKRGEFAANVTNYINNNSNIICGDYHDFIEKCIAVDEFNKPILVKSGKNKGEMKVIGAQAISTINMKKFNNNLLNVLSIKNSSDITLNITIDIIIITTPYCENIYDILNRFKNVNINSSIIHTYLLYSGNTIEQQLLQNRNTKGFISIKDNSNEFENLLYDNGDIIL